jgi:uncharacterized membrane protein
MAKVDSPLIGNLSAFIQPILKLLLAFLHLGAVVSVFRRKMALEIESLIEC